MSAYPEVDTCGRHAPDRFDACQACPPALLRTGFKTGPVARATAPGASVSAVAREHGINANQLFTWIALARKRGTLGAASSSTAAMVPVGVSLPAPSAVAHPTSSCAPTASALEVELPVARLRFEGAWEPASVAALVRLLSS